MSRPRYPSLEIHPLSLGALQALLVSGEPERRQRLRTMLGGLGFELTAVRGAADAIPSVRKCPPSALILCDDLKKTPDALGLLKWLAHQDFGHSVYTLVLCDTTDAERTRRLILQGACDLLSFDFTEREMRERLQLAEHRRSFLEHQFETAREAELEVTRYRHLVRHWPQAAILTTSLKRPIIQVNLRALEILALEHDEVVGKHLSLVLPGLLECAGFDIRADFSKDPHRFENVRYDGPTGPIILEVRIVGIEWAQAGAVLVTFENAARVQAGERHRRRRGQIEFMGRFACEMAHTFNNILTVVSGNLALLHRVKRELPATSQELLESSLQACQEASSLVKRLTKHDPLEPSAFAMLDVKGLVVEVCRKTVVGNGAKVRASIPRPLRPIMANRTQLTEVLAALITNADEALAENVIEVQATNVLLGENSALPLEPGDYVRIQVRDHGPGISSEIVERIFEPFFTTRPEASGLGLSRAFQIIEEHGGTLGVEEPLSGAGACFVLHLPACPGGAASDAHLPWNGRRDQGRQDLATGGPARMPRVLFMDDEPDIRTIVDKMLSAHAFEVTCVSTGEEAVEAYYKSIDDDRAYDVLLLDLEVVSGMGGKDTISILRQDFPNIRAVVTTGYLDDVVLSNHREHGFSGVLTKPFQMEDLVTVLRTLARGHSH